MSGTAGKGSGGDTGPTADEPRATPRRRRHRRVVAPPTNPGADPADDVPPGVRPAPARAAEETRPDPRDAWIKEQRPPHWD